jgi:hypothetical protein
MWAAMQTRKRGANGGRKSLINLGKTRKQPNTIYVAE